MVTRVGTATGTVARLSEMLRTSCELIRVFNTLWQGAWSGSYTAKTGFRQGVAPATHLRNQQRLREALGCVRWLREVAA